MASKQSGLLATLGKRILGFNVSSSGCCAAPAAADDGKTTEVKGSEVSAPGAGCCAPSPGDAAARAGSGAKPSA